VLPSLSYIPGRVIRGALAGWALRNHADLEVDGNLFQRFFTADEQDVSVSWPCCTYRGRLPAPLSLFERKAPVCDPVARLAAREERISGIGCDDGPRDYLLRSNWPADEDLPDLRPCRGSVSSDGYDYYPPFPLGLEMKAGHDPASGRVAAGTDGGGLFVVEVMPAAGPEEPQRVYYRGELRLRRDAADLRSLLEPLLVDEDRLDLPGDAELADPDPRSLLFLGRKGVPAVVYCRRLEDDGEDESPSLAVTLASDVLLDPGREWRSPRAAFLALLGLGELAETGDGKVRAFCRFGRQHGFDTVAKKPLVWPTLVAGSCLRLELGEETEAIRSRLRVLADTGIGRHRRDGFGRLLLDWNLHQVGGEESC
jgi:hypothetical protein